MNLYIDLNKAVQIPNTATDSMPERQRAREYNESFTQRSGGVDNEPDDKIRTEDTGNTGSLDDDLEDARKLDTQIAQERGVVGKPDEAKKSLGFGVDLLKAMTAGFQSQLDTFAPNAREIEYLVDVCHHDREDVLKGRATITGSERDRFNTWLQDELRKSIRKLVR